MNEKKTKILSFVAVLLMMGTLLATLPSGSGVNGDENGNITINLQDVDNNPVNGYHMELYDVLNGEKFVYNNLSFTTTLKYIPAGNYELLVPTQEIGNKVYFSNNTLTAVYPASTAQVDLTLNYAPEQYTINGTVKTSTNNTLSNATVTLLDTNTGFMKKKLTNQTGYYEMSAYAGNFLIKIEYSGYVINYTYENISADVTVNGTLRDTPYLWGSVLDENGEVMAEEVNIILYDKNQAETLLYTSDTGAYMVSIYNGNFSMFVTAEGYNMAYIPYINCSGSSIHEDSIYLTKATKGSLSYDMSFANNDLNTLNVEQSWKISPAETINALAYSDFGNLRLQIDRCFGDMDGTVNATEKDAFMDWLGNHTLPTTSYPLIEVNGTYYRAGSIQSRSIEGLEGSVNSTSPIFINTSWDMRSYNTINASSDISVKMLVNYDSTARDYSYSLTLPAGYERAHLSAPSDVDVSGFREISIEPSAGEGTATVIFDMEKSLAGKASINVATGEYAYQREDMNNTYIVKNGKNISFTADFTDPNGNEDYANYSWNFGDGTAYGKSALHSFSTGGVYDVILTVKEAEGEGNTTTANVTIQVDDTNPLSRINTNTTEVDEHSPVEFNASASTDRVHGTIEGIITGYLWDFGDNSTSTQKVVDHSYEKWGTYTVKLTVTDAVGNSANTTRKITVDDVTKPVPRFNWTDVTKNETHSFTESTAVVYEGDEVEFNATPSYDPPGYSENGSISSYSWTIKSGNSTLYSSSQSVISFTFTDTGDYTVELNVTDASNNYNAISKVFQVKYGPRPRLEVNNLTLSTNSPVEGEEIHIIANVSNFGDADANSPVITFFVNGDPLGGDLKFYRYENGSLVESSAIIPKGEYRIVKIAWTPAQETYTVKVNATDPEEPSGSSITHEKEIKVTVGPASWKGMIPVIILIVVIVGIVGLYYAYTKGIGPFGEGFKKSEKKEKGKKKGKK